MGTKSFRECILAVGLLCGEFAIELRADEPIGDFDLEARFSESLTSNFQSQGDVQSHDDGFTLGKDATLVWDSESGTKFGIELDVDWPEFQLESATELEFVFVPQGLGDFGLSSLGIGQSCGFTIRGVRLDGKFFWEVTARTYQETGRTDDVLVKRTFDGERFPSSLHMTYAYGALVFRAGELEVVQSYVDNFCAGINQIQIHNLGLPVRITRLRGRRSERTPLPSLLDRLRLVGAANVDLRSHLLQEQYEYEQALPLQRSIHETCRQILGVRHLYSIRSGTSLAVLLRMTHDTDGARELLSQLEPPTLLEFGPNHPETALLLEEKASLALELEDPATALAILRETHRIRSRSRQKPLDDYLRGLADDLESMRDWKPSLKIREMVVEIRAADWPADHWRNHEARFQRENTRRLSTLSTAELAELQQAEDGKSRAYELLDKGELTQALAKAQAAFDIYARILGRENRETAYCATELGLINRSLGKYEEAAAYYEMDRDITRVVQGENHPEYAAVLENTSRLYVQMGRVDEAESLLLQALRIRRENAEQFPNDYATCLDMLGRFHGFTLGRIETGLPLIEEAYLMRRKHNALDSLIVSRSLTNLGHFSHGIGDPARAIRYFQESLAIKRKHLAEEDLSNAAVRAALGRSLCAANEPLQAKQQIERAIEIVVKLAGSENTDYPQYVNFLAAALEDLGEFDAARQRFQEALAVRSSQVGEQHRDCAEIFVNLARLSLRQGEFVRAEEECQNALRVLEATVGRDHASYHIGEHLLLTIHVAAGGSQDDAFATSARLLIKEEQQLLDRLSVLSETQQLANLRVFRGELYQYLVLGKKVQADPEQVYQHVISWKSAIALRTALDRLDSTKDLTEIQQQLRAVRARLSEFVFNHDDKETPEFLFGLGQLELEKERLQRLVARQAVASTVEWNLVPRRLAEALPAHTCLVDFVRVELAKSEARYHAFVITSATESNQPWIHWIDLGSAPVIDRAILDWRQCITSGDDGLELACLLRKKVWEPLEACLTGLPELTYLCPDGVLTAIPWNALPGREEGSFLIEETAISTLPFSQFLLLDSFDATDRTPAVLGDSGPGDGIPSATDQVLLVGDLNYGSGTSAAQVAQVARLRTVRLDEANHWVWGRIPATADEIQAIASLATPRPTTILRQDAATLNATVAALKSARYVHIASHGFFAGSEPTDGPTVPPASEWSDSLARNPFLLTGIVLSGANQRGEDQWASGILSAEAIASLPLDELQLVTLSACETGLGTVAGGEGVYGLQRAFHLAGARHVMASLWKVEDQATAVLMKLFYHYLWSENMAPAQAMRKAQRTLLREPSLVGDDKALEVAMLRGPLVQDPVKLKDPKTNTPAATAPIRQWAAFLISGS